MTIMADQTNQTHDDGRHRKADMAATGLSPESLVGSWFIHDDGWGIIVGEVQPGVYLAEDEEYGRQNVQRLVTVQTMVGERWTFYDTEEAMKVAWAEAAVTEGSR